MTRTRKKTPKKLKLSVLVVLFAGVTRPSTAMDIRKVDTSDFPTFQMDLKNSTVAPSYQSTTFSNPVLKKVFVIFLTNPRPMTV